MAIRQIAALIQCHWRICWSQNARLPSVSLPVLGVRVSTHSFPSLQRAGASTRGWYLRTRRSFCVEPDRNREGEVVAAHVAGRARQRLRAMDQGKRFFVEEGVPGAVQKR